MCRPAPRLTNAKEVPGNHGYHPPRFLAAFVPLTHRDFAPRRRNLVTAAQGRFANVGGMRLPSADRAIVDPEKVQNYLLSRSHPVGIEKARVFESLGYRRPRWRRLQYDLFMAAQQANAEEAGVTAFGRKYRIRAILRGPYGRSMPFTTVWIVLFEEGLPRFVTAYPDLS